MNQQNKLQSQVKVLTIDNELVGQRIDNFLLKTLKNIPKTRIYRMLRKGEVRVNKKRISSSYRLQGGDHVRIPPFWYEAEAPKKKPTPRIFEILKSRMLYEDANLLILNKPSGMAVHGGSGINFGVIEAMRILRPELKSLELVHRLDRETSGCLILAKKHSVLRVLHEMLREGKITKRYLVLVKGKWTNDIKKVDLPLEKQILISGERMVKVNYEGKSSLTIFRPKTIYSKASLLEAELHTGRTHQIRVHGAAIGFPVAGDEKYGDKDFNQLLKKNGLNRLFLHAELIEFKLPGKQEINVTAPLDDELRQFLAFLKDDGLK